MSNSKQSGTKRARESCCEHIDSSIFSIDQLRLLLLKVLPEGAVQTSSQPYVCLSCQSTATNGFQEPGSGCDHLVSLDPQKLELHCRRCQDYVYLESFDEALLLACQQWLQQKRPTSSFKVPSNDPGPAMLSKRQRLTAGVTPPPEPGSHRSSNDSSQTAAQGGAQGGDLEQQQAAALAAAAGTWEPLVAADGFPLGLRGLNNLGNTCFMNSVLQVMLHAPLLRSFYLGEGHDPSSCRLTARDKPCLSCQMDAVFGEVYSGNRQPFSPTEFLYQWWRFADSLAGYQQQDAHEFYLSLLEGLSGSVLPHTHTEAQAQPAAAAAATEAAGPDSTKKSPPTGRQTQAAMNQQQQQQQQHLSALAQGGPCLGLRPRQQHGGAAAAAANGQSTGIHPGHVAEGGVLNVLGGSMAAAAAYGQGVGLLSHPALPTRQHHPILRPPSRQHHADHVTAQQQEQRQQHVGLPGSSAAAMMNGWPGGPHQSSSQQQQQQQQQQSGAGGDPSGYETPLSSGATPEPEGDTEAASRPPDHHGSSRTASSLVDLVFTGLLRSDVRCCACGHTSTAHDPFRDISLDLHVPRPPRLPPVEPHHRPPPAAAAAAAAADAGGQQQQQQLLGKAGAAAAAAAATTATAAGAADQQAAAEVSPAVGAAARRLGAVGAAGLSAAAAAAGADPDISMREATPPLLVSSMTPSPTPPPSDLMLDYWDNTDNERDTAAGGSRLLSVGGTRGDGGGGASQATSMSPATGGAGGPSTQLSRGDMDDEDEVMQQQQQASPTADGGDGDDEQQEGDEEEDEEDDEEEDEEEGSREVRAGRAARAGGRRQLRGAAALVVDGGGGAVLSTSHTQAASPTPTPEPCSDAAALSDDDGGVSDKSLGVSEVGGPVASQSSQQVGGGSSRAAAHHHYQRATSPELDPAAGAGAAEPQAVGLSAQQQQAAGGQGSQQQQQPQQPHQQRWRRLDVRESTPQSQAPQPTGQQQQVAGGGGGGVATGSEEPAAATAAAVPGEDPPAASAQQQQQQPASGDAAGAGAAGAAVGAAAGGVTSSLVRGVSGGLTQLVKAPMTAIKQLLPVWGGSGEQQDPQQQQLQQQRQPQQFQEQQQQQQFLQYSQQQQQQQQGMFPAGGPDATGLTEVPQQQQYGLPATQQFPHQAAYPGQPQQQPYDQQQQQEYLQDWGMMQQGGSSAGLDPSMYGTDWMQQAHMYNNSFTGTTQPGARAGAAGGPPAAAAAAGGKSGKGAPPKPRQQRCGKCKYCLNRHLKKGCEMNKKLREEAKAAAKVQSRLVADDRASAMQRAAAQRAAQNIAAAAAADGPAAAAAQPVDVSGFGAAAGAHGTQPTHPMAGMELHPGATAGAGWAHPGGHMAMYQQYGDYYQQQQMHPQQHMQQHMLPAAAAAAAGPSQPQQRPQAPPAKARATPQHKAAAAANKVAEKLVAAALSVGLLKKRDERGRFYRKEHLQAWARLLYERGQLAVHGLPPVQPEAAAAAAAAQDAAMAAGTAEWPLPPWMQPEAVAGPAARQAVAGTAAGAGRSASAAAGRPAGQASASKGASNKKGNTSSGSALGKKAQPALLRMSDLTLAGCLRRYVRPERLGAAAHWRCSACGSSTAALKQLSFRRLPLVMCFHVKRFEHGGAAQRARKLDIPLKFPLHGLDLSPFTTSHMIRGHAHARHVRPAPAQDEDGSAAAGAAAAGQAGQAGGADHTGAASSSPQLAGSGLGADAGVGFNRNCLYELFGVVSHWGDMSSGHYVSYIKCEGVWYLINDPWVVAVSEADVAQVQAYMLFYAQEHLFAGAGPSAGAAAQQSPCKPQEAGAAAAVKAEAGVKTGVGRAAAAAGGPQVKQEP